jgi:hypothetical protein
LEALVKSFVNDAAGLSPRPAANSEFARSVAGNIRRFAHSAQKWSRRKGRAQIQQMSLEHFSLGTWDLEEQLAASMMQIELELILSGVAALHPPVSSVCYVFARRIPIVEEFVLSR